MSNPETPAEPTPAAEAPFAGYTPDPTYAAPAATEAVSSDSAPSIPTQAAPVESSYAYSAPEPSTYAAPAPEPSTYATPDAWAQAAPATPTYAAPDGPTYAAPAVPTYAAAGPTYAAPDAPTYAAPTQAYPAGYPAYDAQASAVPASGTPASGVPASGMPASGLPASGAPYGYPAGAGAPQTGYAQAGSPQAGYAPAGYPTAAYPAGMAVPAEPKKPRPKSTIVFAALTVLFVLIAAGMTVLYVGKASDDSKKSKQVASSGSTISSQKTQIDTLKQELQTAQDGAASAKQTSDGQINDLKHTNGLLLACVTDANIVINLQNVSVSAFNKQWDKMVKACLVADAESN